MPAGETHGNAVVRGLAHCTGCGACVPACPVRALSLESAQPQGRGHKAVVVDAARCTGCGACLPACPRQALVRVGLSSESGNGLDSH
jgi:ferredoxin